MGRCSACNNSCPLVPGNGPKKSAVMAIGDRPGRDENGKKRAFMGHVAWEFNKTYLPLAGLSRDDVYFTNTMQCRLAETKPKPAAVAACALNHLPAEIAAVEPQVILLMGATACSLVPKIELDKDHGIPVWVDEDDSEYLGGFTGWVCPMAHPSTGMHDTSTMIPLLEDFQRLGDWLGNRWQHVVREAKPHYELLTGGVLKGLGPVIALDTEDDCGRLWSIQWSSAPNTGYMVMADDKPAVKRFASWLKAHQPEVIMHNAGHDLAMLEQMGVQLTRFRDTMVEAYHLGNLPQGLKPLAWRLCGVRMKSWEDVVTPPSKEKLVHWLYEQAAECDPIKVEKQLKTKVKVTWKRSKLETDLLRILKHADSSTYDLWEHVAETGLKGYPRQSIANVPLPEAIQYAAQDADVTFQVAEEMARLRTRAMAGKFCVLDEDTDQ